MDWLALQHFHFMRPQWLIVLILIYFILKAFKHRDDTLSQWRKIMSPEILQQLTVSGNSQRLFSPQKLTWVLAILCSLILMGPTWKQQPSPFTQDKSALVIALDVSESMEQSDVMPSRLLRAKQKILDLLAVRGDSNTALIAFAGSAHVVMPITNDSEMIRHFLDVLSKEIMPESGKHTQSVLEPAFGLLTSTQVPGTLLLITDSATSEVTSEFKQAFAQADHQLIVWGIGRSQQSQAVEEGSNLLPLREDQLTELAQQSNGRYQTLTFDQNDVNRVNQYVTNNLVIVEDAARPWHDSGYPLVFVMAALFLLWFRKGWTLQW